VDWEEEWDNICWSDETWAQPGKHTKERITRKIGLSEIYHPDCVVHRYQRKIGWMFWGCMSGKYGKGIGIFWEKNWGTINKISYSERIVPRIHEYLQAHPGLHFQQDGGPGHNAQYTREQFQSYGITPIFWPPFSPDLNPIETIWNRLKDILGQQHPEVHTNSRRLRAAVLEAWEMITDEEIKFLIRTEMKERCQAVIDADGRETKF
jgi:transposase